MSITLSTTYKETLDAKVLEIVEELVEDGYELDDVLTTYDYFGENYAESLKNIIQTLEDTDSSRNDLYDFVDEFGLDNLEYFEKYSELREGYDPAAVDAYISVCDISDLENFEEAYEGHFDRVEDFVESILENMGEEIPSWVCVDYEATWNCSLRHDYYEENDYYFRNV